MAEQFYRYSVSFSSKRVIGGKNTDILEFFSSEVQTPAHEAHIHSNAWTKWVQRVQLSLSLHLACCSVASQGQPLCATGV